MSGAVAGRSAVSPLAGRPAPEQMPAQPEAGRPTLQSTFSEAHVLAGKWPGDLIASIAPDRGRIMMSETKVRTGESGAVPNVMPYFGMWR